MARTDRNRLSAVLLLGPSGCGKTPLGRLLERRGLFGRNCHHFDFGAQMRRLAGMKCTPRIFTAQDINVVRKVLAAGELLKDSQFGIAMKVMKWFVSSRKICADDLIVLNGLPRHVGQARDLAGIAEVGLVVYLSCSGRDIHRRISSNSGGDRAMRLDDDALSVAKRYGLFRRRTLPLLTYYRQRKVAVATFRIRVDTGPEGIAERIEQLRGDKHDQASRGI